MTGTEPKSPEMTELMERLVERGNMREAYGQVVGNKGAAGIDGMTVTDLKGRLQTHWAEVKEDLLNGRYEPEAVRGVEIPKPNGGKRQLGIPTVIDRLIQQALYQVLSPIFDPAFSPNSYGFRVGKSAHQAVLAAKEYQLQGKRWVVDIDLAKFFDEVNHDLLMARIAKEVGDKRILRLIRRYLQAGRGRNLGWFIRETLNPLIRGWVQYFSRAETKLFAQELDGWLRRRLRCTLWRQWKRPWTRRCRLMERGLPEEKAVQSAFNRRGPWWNSGAAHMSFAFPKKYFDRLGLFSMVDLLCQSR